jgi:hypothetical protein
MASRPKKPPRYGSGASKPPANRVRAPNSFIRAVSDVSPDLPVTHREIALVALYLGDRLKEILEDHR